MKTDATTFVVQPARGLRWIDARELWVYRELLRTLTARHIKVRYAQSVLGIGWAIVQPLITIAIFTIIFGGLAHVPSEGRPYLVFSLAGVVPWSYFNTAVLNSSSSLSNSATLLTKVYFPRLALPISYVAAPLLDFVIGLALLLVVLLAYGIQPSPWSLLAAPVLLLAMMLTATGVGAGLSALDVEYRDVKHIVPFVMQVWMYASPVVYSMSSVPERYRMLYAMNPMAGIINGFRSTMLNTNGIHWVPVVISLVSSVLIFITGILLFRYRERVFADVV